MINVSIVLYNPDYKKLIVTLECVLKIKHLNLFYIIDNSEKDKYSQSISKLSDKIVFKFSNSNLGFGKAHNIALRESYKDFSVKFHLIVNPDIKFEPQVVESIANYLNANKEVALIMPKVINFNKSVQYLPKLLPTPFSVLLRALSKNINYFRHFIRKNELYDVDSDLVYSTPVISGCFQVLNVRIIVNQDLFDESFFMYFEDWDLSRRLSFKYKTIYFPSVSIFHHYESGANKNLKLFFIFIKSAITYFNKWGWFVDNYRKSKNIEILSQFSK